MYKERRILAVIPARGGSVGVPNKNIRPLCGRPLITHTIEQALAVPEFDMIVVSTDSPEIMKVAEASGVKLIDRPKTMATSEALIEPTLMHSLDILTAEGEKDFDILALLEPTSPLRRPETVRDCIHHFIETDATSLVTLRETHENIGRIDNAGFFRLLDSKAARRRQDREPYYFECGVLYLCRVDHLRKTGTLSAEDWLGVVVGDREAVDINTEHNFKWAEVLLGKSDIEQ